MTLSGPERGPAVQSEALEAPKLEPGFVVGSDFITSAGDSVALALGEASPPRQLEVASNREGLDLAVQTTVVAGSSAAGEASGLPKPEAVPTTAPRETVQLGAEAETLLPYTAFVGSDLIFNDVLSDQNWIDLGEDVSGDSGLNSEGRVGLANYSFAVEREVRSDDAARSFFASDMEEHQQKLKTTGKLEFGRLLSLGLEHQMVDQRDFADEYIGSFLLSRNAAEWEENVINATTLSR
jgi:hypothetical protein